MPSNLETPTLPNPETVALDRLGLMSTFPPLENQRVDLTNSFKYPQMRWAVQHMRELYPTRNIRRGNVQVTDLHVAHKPIGSFTFQDASEQLTSIDEWFTQNYLDALVVLHKGNIVFERYDNQMKPSSSHLLFSVTKSFTGLMAAQLAHEGKIDPNACVTHYVPELSGSAWSDMRVREVMDMTGAVRYREDYTDVTAEIFGYSWASGLMPRPAAYQGQSNIYDFLQTLQKEGDHGAGFVYRTVHSEVLGWIVTRVTQKNWADHLSDTIWQKLGMEEDAHVIVDSVGTPLQGGGLNASARDLARFGEMLRCGGEFNGQRIFAKEVLDDTFVKGGDPEKFKASGMAFRAGYSYRNQWWILHNADGAYEASGIHGQMIHINPKAEMVVVKLASHPVAAAGLTHPTTLKAWAALAKAVQL